MQNEKGSNTTIAVLFRLFQSDEPGKLLENWVCGYVLTINKIFLILGISLLREKNESIILSIYNYNYDNAVRAV